MKTINDFFRNVLLTVRFSSGELMVSNLMWLLFMLPIVTIPPAFAGLYYAASQLAHQEAVTRKTFMVGFKKYFWVSYAWFFMNLIVIGILFFNIDLSFRVEAQWLKNLVLLYWVLLAFWLLLQMYTFPLLIKQDEPRLLLALRNSGLLWLKHAFFSLILAVVLIVLAVISFYLFPLWFLVSAALITYMASLGMISMLAKE